MASTHGTGSSESAAGGADGKIDISEISRYVSEAFDAVPEIGKGHRWYDYPYKALSRVLQSRLGKSLPRRVREIFNYACNYLIPWNEFDRYRAWSRDDPNHNLVVPKDEHVRIPRIWAVEFFPPSELDNLKKAIARNGWDSKRIRYGIYEPNADLLDRFRKEAGWARWPLGAVFNDTATVFIPNAQRRKLPKALDSVELTAYQVGPSLTAVVASFRLSRAGQESVDQVWHSVHEPKLYFRRGGRPGVRDRLWNAFHETQTARRLLHEAVREWMTEQCPGFFANAKASQPLVDLVLLERHDPTLGGRTDRDLRNALRAIGIKEDSEPLVSEDLPGLLMEFVDESMCPALNGRYTKTLWGQVGRTVNGIGDMLSTYGGSFDQVSAIGHFVDRRIGGFLVNLAIVDFLQLKRAQHAVLRDQARARHGRFNRRDLQHLRDSFLTTSLDINSIARDVSKVRQGRYFDWGDAVFFRKPVAWLEQSYVESGSTPRAPINVNEQLQELQELQVKELVEFDADYRSILSTVASIGSSIDAFKVQRIAIWVAFLSLLVALLSLFVTVAGPDEMQSLWRLILS
ncbi:MAG TPA: hypothetical protein VF174_17105 [Micromonosporaceae bacterium]